MRYFAGLDGGGSKCDVVIIDEEGTVHGWGHSGATGYQPQEQAEAAAKAVSPAVEAIVGEMNAIANIPLPVAPPRSEDEQMMDEIIAAGRSRK